MSAAQRRILLITRNLPPIRGGIERLMQHAAEELGRSTYACDVIGPGGCRAELSSARNVWEFTPRLPWFHVLAGGTVMASSGYDLALAGNGLVAPLARIAARRNHCPYAVFVHGLDLAVDHVLYQRLFVPSIRAADAVIANSSYTARLARERGVPADRVHIIKPGTELPSSPADGSAFRRRHALGDGPLVLMVGRLVPRKGIAEFIERGWPVVLKRSPEASLLIIGEEPTQAVGARSGTRSEIERAVARAGSASSVLLLGGVDDGELAQAYAAATALVFPVLDTPGDIEGFGMVALEAAAHGLPTVAFGVGGVPDAVRDAQTGFVAPSGDYESLTRAVLGLLEQPELRESMSQAARAHAAEHSWARYGEILRSRVEAIR